ncbi:TorD/DmsD family molecular chaperone [Natrinema salsiterrestre]|uniref:Molecular chaperone TorD family protein n=1 Tax=Natrinema salsiterrestre TaxID=2950540 RepID=A0A9Q4Q3T9_9EURY|nr:molecular chaperone TorD family protein [Natrinema salsiterrestre]MDF9746568.1 molecular chaperone TorD family protein [Natrinema salsiterrestre]
MTPTHTTPDPEYHAARATLYCAAAAAFTYPTEDTVRELLDPEAREGIERAAEQLTVSEEATALLEALEETPLEELQTAYNELFGLPSDDGTYAVIPYEAHYTTRDEISSEQRRIATVVGLMEEFGLEPSDDFAERQDHVAAELELAQVLAGQRAVALESGEPAAAERVGQAEATVLADHLVEFVPALAHDLRRATDEPAYEAAADLVEELVTYDNGKHPDPSVSADAANGGETP